MTLWESRCYFDGIPDEIPVLLESTGRAPSYKSIALCILRNDLKLKGLGFTEENKQWVDSLYWEKRRSDENKLAGQSDMFDQ